MIRSTTPSKTMRTGGDDMCAWRVTHENWLSQAGGIPKLSQPYEVDGYARSLEANSRLNSAESRVRVKFNSRMLYR